MQITAILIWSFIPPLIMLLWVWSLRFPQTWVFKVCLAFEVLITLLILLIELDARQTPGNGRWMMIFFAVFQIYLGLGIGIVRLVMWCLKDRK